MPKKISEEDYKEIENILREVSTPISVDIVMKKLFNKIPRRTLQRRLAWLVKNERIKAIGERGGRRYQIPSTPLFQQSEDSKSSKNLYEIPITQEAIEIGEIISKPLTARTPIGYQYSFLEDYKPNVTHYLNGDIQNKLMESGQVGASNQPAGTYLRQLLDRLLIDLSWNSSRLEGNTYSLLETERLIQAGESTDGKETRETQMILNHKGAIEMLADQASEIGFNKYTICNLHALLSDNLLADPGACGRIRTRAVAISGTVFFPLEIPQAIQQQFQMILDKAEKIINPFEQAFFMMVHLPYLQPFEDVNKRVSRLAANISLIKLNLCPLSFVDVPQKDYINGIIGIYELNQVDYLRDVFIWAYQRSCARYSAIQQSLGQPDPIRVKYRSTIKKAVSDIITNDIKKKNASKWISDYVSSEISNQDKQKVIEVIETEISSLHEGSIARYRIRLSKYKKWKEKWT